MCYDIDRSDWLRRYLHLLFVNNVNNLHKIVSWQMQMSLCQLVMICIPGLWVENTLQHITIETRLCQVRTA